MTTATTQAVTETITQIALDELHESPFTPRKTFADVDELATNILAEGRIHQPLLVRPRITNPLRDDLHDGFEIVFGHRRYRAAERAGLQTVPCMVRAMSSAEARRAQIAENLARTDVHPIEEAEGFAAMLEHDGVTADDLAVIVGKSRSYIYGRLKLLQACPEVRQACLDGKIGSEVALLVARLRTVKLQEKALAGVQWADRALVAELHGVKDLDTLKAGIDTMALPQLTALLMDCVLVDDVLQQYGFNANMKPRPLLALAEHYGVDAQAVMAAAEQAAKPASTPSPAGASAKKAKTPPPAPARGVKYRDPMTLQTWSGRGLRPAWINAAIAGGKSLSDFEVKPEVKKVKIDAGVAGERCQHTGDLLEAAGV